MLMDRGMYGVGGVGGNADLWWYVESQGGEIQEGSNLVSPSMQCLQNDTLDLIPYKI